MWKRALRIGIYVFIGFVVGSLILGTVKGNAFSENIVYGLWTGAIAGAVVAVLVLVVLSALSARRRT